MNVFAFPRRMPAGVLTMAVLSFAAGRAHADVTLSLGFDTSVPTAYVTYSANNTGGTTTEDVYVGPFSVSGSSSVPSTMFCIDLWHNMSGGESLQGTVSSATNVASQGGWFPYPSYTPRESDPTLTSQLNYLGSVYLSLSAGLSGGARADAVGAIQLGIWYLIDKNFAVSGVGNDPHGQLLSDFGTSTSGIVGLLNGKSETIEGITFAGWSSGSPYSAGTLVTVDRSVPGQSDWYQNMIGWSPVTVNVDVQSAPEPSTFVMAGLGALAFIGYAARRRARS